MRTESTRETEEAAVVRVVHDYFEGWFGADADRMERALHPELAKRRLETDDDGTKRLETATAQDMVDATQQGIGTTRGEGDRHIEVEVEDIYGAIANVTARSTVYREYLQLVRTDEGWKIVNALWQWV